MKVKSHKRLIESTLLHRAVHADVFDIGTAPRFVFVLFGGTGIDEEEYFERGKTVIPIFERVVEEAASDNIELVMVHATAPFDVPLNRFDREPEHAAVWNQHVLVELLEPWSTLPYFVAGFSGGAALALNGLQSELRCFGAAVFGADRLPHEFTLPNHWQAKLRSYVAPLDTVAADVSNVRARQALVNREQMEEIRLTTGRHRLIDYSTADGLGDAIRLANRILATR